ncbi:hypothetical protein MAV_0280 [Mycobacterium avium 104]|uniref:Uncharacterized protein n=1 Tax=Mycobacterium avium (strain 104) TaxID=243243 RepID=A0A0H2ZSJ5_MYCA1|nr:hypothetical protein MAV_0280 [Mycobacterium avium 104]
MEHADNTTAAAMPAAAAPSRVFVLMRSILADEAEQPADARVTSPIRMP